MSGVGYQMEPVGDILVRVGYFFLRLFGWGPGGVAGLVVVPHPPLLISRVK